MPGLGTTIGGWVWLFCVPLTAAFCLFARLLPAAVVFADWLAVPLLLVLTAGADDLLTAGAGADDLLAIFDDWFTATAQDWFSAGFAIVGVQ